MAVRRGALGELLQSTGRGDYSWRIHHGACHSHQRLVGVDAPYGGAADWVAWRASHYNGSRPLGHSEW